MKRNKTKSVYDINDQINRIYDFYGKPGFVMLCPNGKLEYDGGHPRSNLAEDISNYYFQNIYRSNSWKTIFSREFKNEYQKYNYMGVEYSDSEAHCRTVAFACSNRIQYPESTYRRLYEIGKEYISIQGENERPTEIVFRIHETENKTFEVQKQVYMGNYNIKWDTKRECTTFADASKLMTAYLNEGRFKDDIDGIKNIPNYFTK